MFNDDGGIADDDFRSLFDALAPLLVRIAARIAGSQEAAEDVVQDAFIRMLEKRIPFPSRDDAKYWLIRVVKNAAINVAKRSGRERKAYEKWFKESEDSSDPADRETLRGESMEELRRVFDLLPEAQRSVLILKEYGELNYKEIGRVLGITEGNVKIRVFRAREALARLLEKAGPYVP